MNKSKTQQVAELGIEDLLGIGLTFVVLGIGITYGLNVQADVRTDTDTYECASGLTWNRTASDLSISDCYMSNGTLGNHTGYSAAYTGATDSINATGKLASKQGLIVTVVVAAVVIGILVRYLWVKYS